MKKEQLPTGVGNGNVVSNDGTVVGYIDYSSGAVYYLGAMNGTSCPP